MASLPTVGGSNNTWGTENNDFHLASHDSTGNLKDGVAVGTNPAASGALRLPNTKWVSSRNAANNADINLWRVNGSNFLEPGANIYRDDDNAFVDGDTTSFISLRRRLAITTSARGIMQVLGYVSGTATVGERLTGIASTVKDDSNVANKTITNATRVSTTVTVTANGHGFLNGSKAGISGVVHTFNAEINGSWTISNVTTNTFDITVPGLSSGTYTSGGTATNRPMMFAFGGFVYANIARGGLTGTAAHGDDVACFVGGNYGTAKATDAYYLARNAAIAGSEWTTVFTADANADFGIRLNGTYTNYGVDLNSGVYTLGAIRLKNNSPVVARNAAGAADISLIKLNASDQVEMPSPVLVGASPAASGVVRIPNNNYVVSRNAANSGDVVLIGANASDEIQIGNGAIIRFPVTIARMTDLNFEISGSAGLKIGTATTQKVGLYNVTPIAQRAGAAQAAVVTTASTQTTPWGFSTQAQADAIVTLVNELRAWAVAFGAIKGSA